MKTKNKVLTTLFLFATPLWAMQPGEQLAIDQYISERRKIEADAAPVVNQITAGVTKQLDELEKKTFPILVMVDRASADILRAEARIEKRMAELKSQADFNPYTDPEWKREAKRDLVQLCCDIKADPQRQQQIQNRVAQGLSALNPRNRGARNTPNRAGFNQKLGKGGGGGGGGGQAKANKAGGGGGGAKTKVIKGGGGKNKQGGGGKKGGGKKGKSGKAGRG